MAALRIFARSKLSTILRTSTLAEPSNYTAPILNQIDKRWSGYHLKGVVKSPETYTDYEVSKDPKEWEYVTRLLRPKTIPKPPTGTEELPSGWKPRTCNPSDYPYFIQRTRNHMHPVYLDISYRGLRKVTEIRKIHGDIWTLHNELKERIEKLTGRKPGFRINELAGRIDIRGDYVSLVKQWMGEKGF